MPARLGCSIADISAERAEIIQQLNQDRFRGYQPDETKGVLSFYRPLVPLVVPIDLCSSVVVSAKMLITVSALRKDNDPGSTNRRWEALATLRLVPRRLSRRSSQRSTNALAQAGSPKFRQTKELPFASR